MSKTTAVAIITVMLGFVFILLMIGRADAPEMAPIVDPICAPGYELVGEGCISTKEACEIQGDNYYFDEEQRRCLVAQEQACTMDAKICPDGGSVGRTGPNCEFSACPMPGATSATVTTFLGGSATAMNVTLQPKEVVSDSRCPEGVQCIWAGTVEVRTVMATQVSHGEQTVTLGVPVRFGEFSVTLTDVTPYPKQATGIAESSYRFTYKIEKGDAACAPGTERVGEGCMPLKDACEIRGDNFYFDAAKQECLAR